MKEQIRVLDQVSFREAFLQVFKNWWVVLLLTLAMFFGATGVGQLTYIPQYTASATLVTRMKGTDAYTSLFETTQMTTVYKEIFQSEALRKLVSESIGEPVEGSISCSQIAETNLLVLSVSSPTPRQAYLFIQAALRNYERVAEYVFADVVLEIVQEPSVPETPSNTSFLIAHRGELSLLTAMLGGGAIILIYMLRPTVKSAASAPALLDGKVLGIVPFEKKQRKGKKHRGRKKDVVPLLINSPLVSMDFAESVRRTATRLEAHMRRKKCQVLLVCSVAENEGKSTVAANIAIALAEHGDRVLLLDGDLRKPAQYKIAGKGDEKKASLSDALSNSVSWNDACVSNERGGFEELLQYRPVLQPGNLLAGPQLPALMTEIRKQMDYIVVDSPPAAAAADAELWMHQVDTALLVVRQDSADVRVINDTVDLIWKSTGDFSGFILNAFPKE